jgi:hypothetical protein
MASVSLSEIELNRSLFQSKVTYKAKLESDVYSIVSKINHDPLPNLSSPHVKPAGALLSGRHNKKTRKVRVCLSWCLLDGLGHLVALCATPRPRLGWQAQPFESSRKARRGFTFWAPQ